MRGGYVDAISRRVVAGWAADPDQPGERLTVAISVDGQHLGDVVADRLRNDLASLGRFGDGRHGFSFTFPEPLGEDADHVVRVVYRDDGAKLPNGEQRISGTIPAAPAPPPPSPPPAVQPPPVAAPRPAPGKPGPAKAAAAPPASLLMPILVTAPGRSGTTLLMGLLARSPDIVASELVPYELRLISYYAAAFNVLTAPANLEKSTHPDRLEGDGFHIGFNPFQNAQYAHAFTKAAPVRDYFENYAPTHIAACTADLVREYYRRLAGDRGKHGARYFAEKNNNVHKPTRLFTRQAFGAVREIVIVRDPRDVLCSHVSYFSSTPDKAFTQLSHSSHQLRAIRAEQRSDIHVLKYEDMVHGDAACFAALSDFLGTTILPDAGQAGERMFQKHATSTSPEASVERWRTQLPAELRQRCADAWGPFLETFGYAIT
jgi:hypothetical protein